MRLIQFYIVILWSLVFMAIQSQASVPTHFNGNRYFNPFPTFKVRGNLDILKWMIWDRITGKRPSSNLAAPEFKEGVNNPDWLKQNRKQFSVTWIGHSTLLVQMDGINILTDPIFSERCSPFSFIGPKRIMPPGLPFDSLPPIDLVLISHDHYDHLDKKTIKALGNKPFYLVPMGVGQILHSWGITRYAEMDWQDRIVFNKVEIICTPAQHFSGRTPFNQNGTLWASWLLKGPSVTFYFGGDTGYFPGFTDIARQCGAIDFAALPIGAYAPRWFMKSVHMNPDDALKAFNDLQANIFIPIHWGTFRLSDEPMEEPPELLMQKAEALGIANRIWLLKHGETRIKP